MGIGLGVTIALVIVWAMRGEVAPLGVRLARLGAAVAALGAWVAVAVGAIARRRFFSADAIDAGGDDETDASLARSRGILQNTLEQAVIAALAYTSLALVQDRARLLIVALVTLFSVGRVLFWVGYADGAASRTLGFALTFYPSVAGLLIAFATLVLP